MNSLDTNEIRLRVFELYKVPLPNPTIDPPSLMLMRAHYSYVCDPDFDERIRDIKKEHEMHLELMLKNIDSFKNLEEVYAPDRKRKDAASGPDSTIEKKEVLEAFGNVEK